MRVQVASVMLACGLLAACPEAPTPQPSEPPSVEPPAVSVPAYVGTWAQERTQCDVPQEAEGAPMIIAADRFDQHEAHCVFDAVTQTSPNHWRIEASCSVEGDAQQANWEIAIEGDTMRLTPGGEWVRCQQ